jgi:hypothetical protein
VDSEEQVLIRSRTNNIRSEEEWPRNNRTIAEEICAEDLKAYDKGNEVFGKGFGTA